MRKNLERLVEVNSGVCVGLDPDPSKFPAELDQFNIERQLGIFLHEVITITSPIACAYKIQKAFFDRYEFGSRLLKKTIRKIRDENENIPIIIDCKVGDIENTMKAYAANIFETVNADAIVVNPYMGDDVFNALETYADRGIVTLFKTSNPGSSVTQEVRTKEGLPYWRYLLRQGMEKWNKNKNIIPVVSSSADIKEIRKEIPEYTPILFAGVGAQGADIDQIRYLFNSKGGGVFVNSSRGILYPYERSDPNWREKIYSAAKELEKRIQTIRNQR